MFWVVCISHLYLTYIARHMMIFSYKLLWKTKIEINTIDFRKKQLNYIPFRYMVLFKPETMLVELIMYIKLICNLKMIWNKRYFHNIYYNILKYGLILFLICLDISQIESMKFRYKIQYLFKRCLIIYIII